MPIQFPNASLGVVHPLGEIMTADRKNGSEFFVRGDRVVVHHWRNGEKILTVEFNAAKAADAAEFLNRGAAMLMRSGGSGLPQPVNSKPTVLHTRR